MVLIQPIGRPGRRGPETTDVAKASQPAVQVGPCSQLHTTPRIFDGVSTIWNETFVLDVPTELKVPIALIMDLYCVANGQFAASMKVQCVRRSHRVGNRLGRDILMEVAAWTVVLTAQLYHKETRVRVASSQNTRKCALETTIDMHRGVDTSTLNVYHIRTPIFELLPLLFTSFTKIVSY